MDLTVPGTSPARGASRVCCYRWGHGRPTSAGEIRFVRLLVGSSVVGLEPPSPQHRSHMSQETFAALGVSAESIAALEERGITSPFQIQSRAIPPALAGTDLLAKSPTGSGKTLAFAIPLVERVPRDNARPAALVLVPTRELALQVTEQIEILASPRDLQ